MDDVKIQITSENVMNAPLRKSVTWAEAKGIKWSTNESQIIIGDNSNQNELFSLAGERD